MIKEIEYKKILAYLLHEDAIRKGEEELRTTSFYDEETTENWTLEKLQIEFVKDQIRFFEGGNLEDEVEFTWKLIFKNEDQ
jgi:hypothetical protein